MLKLIEYSNFKHFNMLVWKSKLKKTAPGPKPDKFVATTQCGGLRASDPGPCSHRALQSVLKNQGIKYYASNMALTR